MHFLYTWLGSIPVLLVWIVGVILCLRNAGRDSRAAVLVGSAIMIMVFGRFILPFAVQAIVIGFQKVSLELNIFVSSFIYSLPTAVAWGLMFAAVFGRKPIDHE